MNKEILKKLILQAQEQDVQFIQRDLEIFSAGKINTIIGPRRAGKTFFMYQTMNQLKQNNKERIIYLNFEDERLIPIQKEELDLILESYYELFPENHGKKIFMFLDEIQALPFWQLFIRRLSDQENVEIFITGSSSKLLSKEIATELRGRTLTYNMYPFSFTEFLRAKGIVLEKHYEYTPLRYKIRQLLEEYLEFGGFPEIADKDELLKVKILQEYFDLIFYKDLVERYKIRNFEAVKELLLFVINNFSSYFSVNKHYNLLKSQGKKISKNTLFTYLSFMGDINFLFLISKYGKLKEQFVNPKKIYVVDTGLINAVSFKVLANIGRLYENAVLVELKRRGNEVYYWKKKYECDFIVKEREKVVQAIQVCYEITRDNKNREINGIIEVIREFDLGEGLIITGDLEEDELVEGMKIHYKPLWKWLLQ